MVFGPRHGPVADAPDPEPAGTPRETLERALVPALERTPCVVAFSGGRDSSALLAEATRVARANGLEDPVPLTLTFPGAPRTQEEEWQQAVIDHLGLGDWVKQPVTDELDSLGPVALDVLRAQGVHWPPNVHTFQLWFDHAAGGSLLTGNGGDEIFNPFSGHRINVLMRAGTRPRAYDLKPLLRTFLPNPLLVQWLRRRGWLTLPWLTPEAGRELEERYAVHSFRIPRTWGDELENYLNGRYVEVGLGFTGAMAREAGVNLVEPFFDADYIRAVRADSPPQGYGTRTLAVEKYFGDLLPPEVVDRSTKAVFTEVFCGPATRKFAQEWDGVGIDPALVDREALRAEWLSEVPDLRSLVPLQAAWLAGG